MEHDLGTDPGQQTDPTISDDEMNKQMMDMDEETKEGEPPQE